MKNIFKILLIVSLTLVGIQGCSNRDIQQDTQQDTQNEQETVSSEKVNLESLVITGQGADISLEKGILLYKGEPFSGKLTYLYENGDTASVANYYLGKENGWSFKWYQDGTEMEERYYENGVKEGMHKAWYEDGTPRFIYNFIKGEYNGGVKEWYPNGQMYKDFNYVNGYETGMQTAWEFNGKLLANYEVKNGRKYGLSGTHNCKSLWDDNKEDIENESIM